MAIITPTMTRISTTPTIAPINGPMKLVDPPPPELLRTTAGAVVPSDLLYVVEVDVVKRTVEVELGVEDEVDLLVDVKFLELALEEYDGVVELPLAVELTTADVEEFDAGVSHNVP